MVISTMKNKVVEELRIWGIENDREYLTEMIFKLN
jgi:hypothetical protein